MKVGEPSRRTCTPDFPTPPPAVTDELGEQALDEYLSLKVRRGELHTENWLVVSQIGLILSFPSFRLLSETPQRGQTT